MAGAESGRQGCGVCRVKMVHSFHSYNDFFLPLQALGLCLFCPDPRVLCQAARNRPGAGLAPGRPRARGGMRFSRTSPQVRNEREGSSQPSGGACRRVTFGAWPFGGPSPSAISDTAGQRVPGPRWHRTRRPGPQRAGGRPWRPRRGPQPPQTPRAGEGLAWLPNETHIPPGAFNIKDLATPAARAPSGWKAFVRGDQSRIRFHFS